MTVADAWTRSGKTGGNSAVYFTITNALPETDSLRLALDFQNHPDLTLDIQVREIREVS